MVDSVDSDWQMLPHQARSISSDQVQMQRQQSLVSLLLTLHSSPSQCPAHGMFHVNMLFI